MQGTLIGVLQTATGPSRVAPHVQPVILPRNSSGSLSIICRDALGARLDLTGGALYWNIDDGAGGSPFTVQGTITNARNGLAFFPFSSQQTVDLGGESLARYDVDFVDLLGTYGVAGATYQLVPPSLRGLSG